MKGAAHLRDPLNVIPRTTLGVATPPGFAEEEAAPPTGTHEATAALGQTQPAGAEPPSFPGNADPPTQSLLLQRASFFHGNQLPRPRDFLGRRAAGGRRAAPGRVPGTGAPGPRRGGQGGAPAESRSARGRGLPTSSVAEGRGGVRTPAGRSWIKGPQGAPGGPLALPGRGAPAPAPQRRTPAGEPLPGPWPGLSLAVLSVRLLSLWGSASL